MDMNLRARNFYMKYFISLTMGVVLSACATVANVIPKDHQLPNWIHVFDSENRIAASVNSENGKVVYYQSEDVAFKSLFAAMLQQAKAQQAAQAAKAPAPKVEEKPKKK